MTITIIIVSICIIIHDGAQFAHLLRCSSMANPLLPLFSLCLVIDTCLYYVTVS